MNPIAKFLQAAKMMASQGARFDDVVSAFRETFNRTPKGMEVIGIRRAFRDAAEGEKVLPFPQKRSFKQELEEMKPVTEEEVIAKYKQMNEETVKKMREKKGMPPKDDGREDFSVGGIVKLMKKLVNKKDLTKETERFREGPIDSKFLEEVDDKTIEPFIRSRDMSGKGGYGMYESFDEMPAGLKAAELVNRIRTKDGAIDYERAEAFIGKKLKGNESIDELIEMIVTPQRITKEAGGLAGLLGV